MDWGAISVCRNVCYETFLKTLFSKMHGVILELTCYGKLFERIAQFNGVMLAILPPSR